jgi:hypothetical protein
VNEVPTTATHAPARGHTTPPGTGVLSHALEDARDLGRLNDFCSAHVCTTDQVSADGKRLDMLKVFDLMRERGYQVSTPTKPQQQLRKGHTTWTVDVTLPKGAAVSLAFCTPNTS